MSGIYCLQQSIEFPANIPTFAFPYLMQAEDECRHCVIHISSEDVVLSSIVGLKRQNVTLHGVVSTQDEPGHEVDFASVGVPEHDILRLYMLDVDEPGVPGPDAMHIDGLESFVTRCKAHVDDHGDMEPLHLIIHCTFGRSRSPAVALILLTKLGYDWNTAWHMVQEAKPYCEPNAALLQLAGLPTSNSD
jgi:predicted protein tyrosine phosphatase